METFVPSRTMHDGTVLMQRLGDADEARIPNPPETNAGSSLGPILAVVALAAGGALAAAFMRAGGIAALGQEQPTLFYLSAVGCPACEAASPVVSGFERAARGRVRVVRIDAADPRLPAMLVPTLAVRTLAGEWTLAEGLGAWLADPVARAAFVAAAAR